MEGQAPPTASALEQAGMGMVAWQDRQIHAGEKWYPAIQEAIADAVAAVLLSRADYLASGFCIKEEVPYLLDRQEREGMLLVPVLIRSARGRRIAGWPPGRCSRAMANASPSISRAITPMPSSATRPGWCSITLSKLASQPKTATALPKAVRALAAGQGRAATGPARTAASPELARGPCRTC